MLAKLKKWAATFDALSLRERSMVFLAAVAVLIFLFYFWLLTPLLASYARLGASIAQTQTLIGTTNQEIALTLTAHSVDPDQLARTRLEALLKETSDLTRNLRQMQHGLVAPERMLTLLESLLRQHAQLRLVSLTTLPSDTIGQPPPVAAATPAAGAPAVATAVLHRHGVEVVVQGSYGEMVNYMQALQTMPTQVFWGKAHLDASSYPAATLTLTVYTLSMDDKWMAL
ncbi:MULTISPECIES: type II secretion system protein GspM [unclassified Janthinobacterium]|uniref:type II secretion system protein GspM n=1 Tax=unclassified Janthinobacterium TaxID=2610881 RepID=UPI00161130BF|nr:MULTISPECIES: type II secretion system protein GspM [unclassified Janthinobacterium]MBB5368637.1 MSHA biogenesis protein MshJ [Janthinobacterium sp. K2C7]MBB5381827.1 MSHA biogenesis protein MshJ [Janthinobacterium sp. K2Li3]MBB5387019.1 MSHA biogenesis protein MshJ [Janthinobacterium sp. K2E3]